jgi:predicted enzyme related to lactoylglutathione lyase
MAETYPRGRIVWHELLTSDTGAATAFYQSVIGWGILPFKDGYDMWTANDNKPLGGLMVLPDDARKMGAPPSWLMYVAVPNVDAAVKQATGLGATVLKSPTDIPEVGRFAVLNDPQGATFALHRSIGEEPGHDGPPKVGEFSWTELRTTDWAKAWDFYRAMFGWNEMGSMDMGPGGTYQMFGRVGQMLGGMYNKGPEIQGPPHWLHYVRVPNVDTAASKASQLGGKVISQPMDVPGGNRVATLQDPQGAFLGIHAVSAAAMPAATTKRPAAKPKPAAAEKPMAKPVAAKPAAQPSMPATPPKPKAAAVKPKATPKKAAPKARSRPKKAAAKSRKPARKAGASRGRKGASKSRRGAVKRGTRRR